MHKPIADAEKAERCRNEAGLIRRQPREAANPCPAYAKAKEYQRHNATRGRRECAEKAARRHQPLSVECHSCRMRPVAVTGSRAISCVPSRLREPKPTHWRAIEASGVNIETIRHYERIKMLAPPPRTDSGRRVYHSTDLRILVFIRRSRELGFSLDDIRALLRLGGPEKASCREVREIAAHHLEDIRARLVDLKKLERLLAKTVARCSGRMAPDCPVLDILDIERTK